MEQVKTPPSGSVDSRYLPFLVLLFAGSGCSALIYEIVWFQLLQLAIGSTAVSLGDSAGHLHGRPLPGQHSAAAPARGASIPCASTRPWRRALRRAGFWRLLLIPLVGRVYFAWAPHGLRGMLLRGFVAAICLLPPTVLMGASLPAIVRWTEATPRGASWWGLLYGGNTVGAVFGCLLAGFYLLRIYNTTVATFAAVAINLVVAGLSVVLARSAPAQAGGGEPEGAPEKFVPDSGARWPVYVTIGLSGAGALGAEVVWTRLMGMMLGATVYVFSIILAVFLIGLAIGSAGGSWLLRAAEPARGAGLVPASAGGRNRLDRLDDLRFAAVLAHQSRCSPSAPGTSSSSTWSAACGPFCRPRILWGASFPLALRGRRAARRGPRAAWWAACMPPIPWAPSWGRWASAWC